MKTMPLPEIVTTLVKINGCSENLATAFLNEFAQLIADGLIADGNVTVKGIGTFRIIETGDDMCVEFAPDKALSEAVNAPFSIFEPVELDDEITVEMLEVAEDAETEAEGTAEAALQPERAVIEESNNDQHEALHEQDLEVSDNDNVAAPAQDQPQEGDRHEEGRQEGDRFAGNTPPGLPPIPPMPEYTKASEPKQPHRSAQEIHSPETEATPNEPAYDKPVNAAVTHEKIIEKEHLVKVVDKSHHTLSLVLTGLLSLIAGLAIGYFAYAKLNLTGVKSVNISADDVQVFHNQPAVAEATADTTATPENVVPDVVPEEEASPVATVAARSTASPAVVTDTVKSNRFLTTMAQRHYGKKKFWVYIYEENKAKLDNPDMIPANTVVVIPPAEKYGIKAGDPKSEAAAEKLAAEIMNRYH